jgi:hypothetical protein
MNFNRIGPATPEGFRSGDLRSALARAQPIVDRPGIASPSWSGAAGQPHAVILRNVRRRNPFEFSLKERKDGIDRIRKLVYIHSNGAKVLNGCP